MDLVAESQLSLYFSEIKAIFLLHVIMSIIISLVRNESSLLDPLEVLRIILLTPVFLTLLFLPIIISSRDALSSGLLGLPLPFCSVAAGSEILLPLVDEVLDVLRDTRL
jgi:hypothetical protein